MFRQCSKNKNFNKKNFILVDSVAEPKPLQRVDPAPAPAPPIENQSNGQLVNLNELVFNVLMA